MSEMIVFDLQRHQDTCFKALCEVDDLFRRNNIRYFLMAGSALGVVRHKGFIPWDDDIDLGVFRKDVKKASEILQGGLSSTFIYQDLNNTQNYARLFGKIIDASNGRGCIDIFPIVTASDSSFKRRMQWIRRKVYFKLYKAKIGYSNQNENKNLKEKIKLKISHIVSVFFSRQKIMKEIERNETRYETLDKPDYYIDLYGAYSLKRELIRSSWVESEQMLPFNGKQFPVMKDVHEYLTNLYGDYMTIPKENERYQRHNESFINDKKD